MFDEELVKKGELLRDLYLIRDRWTKDRLDFVVNGYDAFKFLKLEIDSVNDLISMLEREVPEWVKERAYQTKDRSGIVIWTEKGTP